MLVFMFSNAVSLLCGCGVQASEGILHQDVFCVGT